MPIWLQIVIAVVGFIGTILGIFGFSAYINERAKHRAQRRNMQEDAEEEELENMRQEQMLKGLRLIIQEEIAPLKIDVADIKQDLSLNTKGTVTILRNDMKLLLDNCRDKGYATSSDVANWNELYNTYKELGGNHFKEYVDAWKKELNELPPKKKTRRRLVENN